MNEELDFKLKPCPFCGCKRPSAEILNLENYDAAYIKCSVCKVQSALVYFKKSDDDSDAITALERAAWTWNCRVPELSKEAAIEY